MVGFQVLKNSRLLAGMSDEFLRALGAIAEEATFKQGEHLFRLGGEAEALLLIGSGTVSLTMPLTVLGVEKELTIEELEAGSTAAWSALVKPYKLTNSAVATRDVSAVRLARDDLLALFEKEPALGFRLVSNLASVIGHRLHVTKAMWLRELQRSVSEKYR